MSTVVFQARIDRDIKVEAESILKQIGVKPSQLLSMLYHQVVNRKGVPFSLTLDDQKNPSALTAKVCEETDQGKDLHYVKNSGELFDELGI